MSRPLRRGNWTVQELERLRALLPRRGVQATAALLRRTPDSVRRRATALFAVPPRKGDWTAADDGGLRAAWGALDARLIGLLLGRPAAEVARRAAVLRATPQQGPWTRAQEQQLKALYGTRSDRDLEVCLQRRAADIAAAARRMCLSKDKRFAKAGRQKAGGGEPARSPRWTRAEMLRLAELYADRENLELARLLGRTVASVANKAWQLGLKKSPDLLERIGRTNIAVRYHDEASSS